MYLLCQQIEPDTNAAAPDTASSAAEAAKSLVSAGALGAIDQQIESTVDGAVQQVLNTKIVPSVIFSCNCTSIFVFHVIF